LLLREAVMQPAVIELNDEDVNADITDTAPLWNALARNGILVFYRGRRIASWEIYRIDPQTRKT